MVFMDFIWHFFFILTTTKYHLDICSVHGFAKLWHWQGRYLRNEFGGLIYENKKVENRFVDDDGNETIETEELSLPVENPNYKDNPNYQSRSQRPEWCVVGLVGQVYVRIDETVKIGDKIIANNGIATADINGQFKVMSITTPFTKSKGYGVAKVFIR